jgi:hypothetical protein
LWLNLSAQLRHPQPTGKSSFLVGNFAVFENEHVYRKVCLLLGSSEADEFGSFRSAKASGCLLAVHFLEMFSWLSQRTSLETRRESSECDFLVAPCSS